MTRPISATLLAELESMSLRPFLLLEMVIGNTTYRYTNCDVSIFCGGNFYDSFAFTLGEIQYSIVDIVDSVDMTFDNIGMELYAAFIADNAQGSSVVLRVVLLDDDYQIIDEDNVYVLFNGFIDEWNLDEIKIQIKVVSIFTTWKQKTLSRHPASCRWKKFKGVWCKYSGDEIWCDRSYARCEELLNSNNFGGFRHLPELEDKELWWGRKPDTPK